MEAIKTNFKISKNKKFNDNVIKIILIKLFKRYSRIFSQHFILNKRQLKQQLRKN